MPAFRLITICACVLITPWTGCAAHLSVWPVDALTKVFADDAPGTNRTDERLWPIPRNGHASIQFAVRSNSAIPALSTSLTLGGGLRAEVSRVGYVPVHANVPGTPTDELARLAPGRFPDPLLEGDRFALPQEETTAVWISVYAPPETKPGTYKGEVVLRAGQELAGSVKFKINVVKAAVPEKQTLRVTNWFYFDEHTMAPYFDVEGKPEKLWELLGNVARVMADHRQNVFLTPVMAFTDAHPKGEGIEYDFSRLDRFVDTVTRTGAMELIEGSHLIERAGGYDGPLKIPAFLLDGAEVKREQFDPDDPRAEAQLSSFLSALYAHLKEKGWLQRYVQHVIDEPHGKEPSTYLRYVPIIRRSLPGVPTMDAFDQDSGDWFRDACDIKVLQLGKFDHAMEVEQRQSKTNGQTWYYTCLFPRGHYPNRFIDYPLLKTRLLHWLNYRYGLTGYLHWGGDSWGTNPFEITELGFAVNAPTTSALPAGDAFITYPWREKNSIHSSIRLEAMREGIEDYELLHALAATDPEKAARLAEEAMPQLTNYIRDVRSFRKLHAKLLAAAQ